MIEYSYHQCPVCGIHYAVDKYVMDYKRRSDPDSKDRSWYCPNGHSLVHNEYEVDKERRRAERAEQQVAYHKELAAAAERRERAQKAQVTKLKKRAAAGVCPCCNRTFQNLQRHMKTKHPDFATEKEPKLKVVK